MFRVVWPQSALDELTAIWTQANAAQRQAITRASHQIDQQLQTNPQSLEEYAAKVKEQMERSLQRKAAQLGYDLVPKTPAAQPS